MPCILLRTVIFLIALFVAQAFVMPTPIATRYQHATALHMESGGDADDITAARIRVKGDVQGGYYRCCVLNEASKFRKLSGMMSNPDDTDEAEIYVEGKRKLVDGFLRWCKKADKKIGMSQVVEMISVDEEEPTGLYDGFYCKVKTE